MIQAFPLVLFITLLNAQGNMCIRSLHFCVALRLQATHGQPARYEGLYLFIYTYLKKRRVKSIHHEL